MSDKPTVADFVEWASKIVLDNGDEWIVEKWQQRIVSDILSGKAANWVVVPEGNGKTTLMAGIALFHLDLLGWGLEQPFVVVAAATREQAEWLYLQAEGMVYSTPGMSTRFKCLSGFRRINRVLNGEVVPGRIQIFAADDRTADGAIFTLGIIDELHNHRDLRLWRRWHGKLAKRGGQLVAISTAGEPGSEFEEARTEIMRSADDIVADGAHVRAEDKGMILNDWAVRDRGQAGNYKIVAGANPRETITEALLKDKHADKTTTPEHWLRFTCNIATRIEGSAILPEDWEKCREEGVVPDPTAICYGGIDLGFSTDCTGLVVLAWESFERRIVAWTKILEPPVDQDDIVAGLVEAQRKFEPIVWVYDPALSGAQMAQMLERGEHPRQDGVQFAFTEHSQTTTPMALAAARVDEAVRSQYIKHDGDPELRKHVLNAVKKDVGGGKWRFIRPAHFAPQRGNVGRKRFPIDALTALSMAHSTAVTENGQPSAEPMIAFA